VNARTALLAALAFLTATALVPAGLTPVVVTSPDTGSMEPTVSTTDVAVLTAAGEPAPGDVVLYRSTDPDTGLVLHRVVDETADGYVTRGDANPTTDQAAGSPPVTDDRIVAVADGDPATVPWLGALLSTPALLVAAWLAAGLWLLLARAEPDPEPTGPPETVAPSLFPLFVAVGVLVGVGVLVLSAGLPAVESVAVVSTAVADEPGNGVVPVGERATHDVRFTAAIPGTYQTATADGDLALVGVRSRVADRNATVVVANPPRESPGAQRATVSVYSFPPVLPRDTLQWATGISPWFAGALAGTAAGSAVLVLGLVVTGDRIRRPRPEVRALRRLRRREDP